MNSLLKFITEHLAFLYGQWGFVFKNSVCDSEDGNALVELQNGDLLFQIVRDRGEIAVFLANLHTPKEFFELSELIEIITGKEVSYNVPDIEAIRFLQHQFHEIAKLLTENYYVALEKRNVIRKKQLYSLGYRDEGPGKS